MREGDTELDLGDYLSLFKRRWKWIVFTVLVVVALVALFTFTRDEEYRSRSEVLFLTEASQTQFALATAVEPELIRNPTAEIEFLASQQFATALAENPGGDAEVTYTLEGLDDPREVTEASVIGIVAVGPTANAASGAANAHADTYVSASHDRDVRTTTERRAEAEERRDRVVAERTEDEATLVAARSAAAQELDPTERQFAEAIVTQLEADLKPRLDVLNSEISEAQQDMVILDQVLAELEDPEASARVQNEAFVPNAPISPDVPRNLLIGAIAGVVLGLIAALARDLLDTRAHDGAEIAQILDVPVIAAIGQLPTQRSAPGGVRRFADLTDADASGYRVLLNSLWLSNVDGPLQSIAFTSDRPGVGKTQTVVNLAQAEAGRGTNVLIVDTDFVNPSVASRLGIPSAEIGLDKLLDGLASINTAVTSTGINNLDLIDAYSVGAHAGDLLRSDRLRTLLSELYSRYDLILLDSAPTLSTADSRLVATQADAAVIVYDPAVSRIDDLERTIDLLGNARANLIGLVANRSRASHPVYLSSAER